MIEYKKINITLQEFDFLRAYIDVSSPTFGNAYRSGLKAGYSKSYCRVIKRNYPKWRMIWLKRALDDEKLIRMIESTRHLDFGTPTISKDEMRRIVRKQERDLIGMSAKEVINALEQLIR